MHCMPLLRTVLVLLLSVFHAAIAADISLPHGYTIEETQPNEHVIVHSDAVIVFGNVNQYAVIGDVVVGFVARPLAPAAEPTYYDDVRTGHFLLDTKSGMLTAGLDERSWLTLLTKLGIGQPPVLKPICSPR